MYTIPYNTEANEQSRGAASHSQVEHIHQVAEGTGESAREPVVREEPAIAPQRTMQKQ